MENILASEGDNNSILYYAPSMLLAQDLNDTAEYLEQKYPSVTEEKKALDILRPYFESLQMHIAREYLRGQLLGFACANQENSMDQDIADLIVIEQSSNTLRILKRLLYFICKDNLEQQNKEITDTVLKQIEAFITKNKIRNNQKLLYIKQ